jgi:hypothetical protein
MVSHYLLNTSPAEHVLAASDSGNVVDVVELHNTEIFAAIRVAADSAGMFLICNILDLRSSGRCIVWLNRLCRFKVVFEEVSRRANSIALGAVALGLLGHVVQ